MHTELVNRYREFDARCAREIDRLSSRREFEDSVFVPSEASKQEAKARLAALLGEAADLPAPDEVYSLLKSHFTEFLMARLSDLETTFSRPGRFVGALTDYVDFLGRQDSRGADERALLLMSRARKADELWSGLARLIPSYGAEALKGLVEACSKLGGIAAQAKRNADREYDGLSDRLRRDLDDALDYLAQKSKAWGEEASHALADASEAAQASHTSQSCSKLKTGGASAAAQAHERERNVDPDAYRVILRDELGVDLDELLSWHEDEVQATRDEVFQALSRINLGAAPAPKDMAGVVDVLNRFAGPCDTPEEMFARMRSYLDRAQTAARSLVRLPEESVRAVPTPYQYRDSYPWGGYGGGCPKRRPLIGEVFLNDGNFMAITDGWIKVNAVHECYPGHHVQWVRATLDPLPETVKMGARGVPLLEGACVRTERLMEPVFPEDPFYPLFVAYRRHHTATRIKADLYLQYFRRPVDEVVDLYVEEMGFDRDTARGQVKAQELMIGYFNCYYYGLKRLSVLQAEYGLSDKDFTEIIFGLPHVSLSTLEKFLRLDAPGKERVLTGFPSLLPS
ncbi:MAG: DUF885 family protein [Bacillota bacterium]